MRCSLLSIAALGFASVALAAPAAFDKRDHGRVKTKVVIETETVTVTEIVYMPEPTVPPRPPSTTAVVIPTSKPKHEEPTPEPIPEPVEPTPEPTPEPETPTPILEPAPEPTPEPTPTPEPEEESPEPIDEPTPTPKPEPTPTPKPEPTPTPAPPKGDSPGDDLTDFERTYLKIHNDLRARTGAPALKVDRTMSSFAQNHIQSCVFEHSSPREYGENLAAGYPSITAVVQAWFDEWKDYNFGKPDFYPGTGHFTQVVWKSATKVGCAEHLCDGKNGTPGTYTSCNYDDGNLIGAFAENVSKPSS